MDEIIALVGGAAFSPDFSETHSRILGLVNSSKPNVVFFPTAAILEGLEAVQKWSHIAMESLSAHGAQVNIAKVIDRESANSLEYSEMVERADVIYLGGGLPDAYLHILQNSRVWNAVVSAHQHGKMIIGASAGAMILGENTLVTEFQGEYPPSRWENGFNFLPGIAIAPHFNTFPQEWVAKIKRNLSPSIRLLGIDEKTAIIKRGNYWKIQGMASVNIYFDGQEKVFTSGDEVTI